jgi:hypothetical protein
VTLIIEAVRSKAAGKPWVVHNGDMFGCDSIAERA